MSWMSFTRFMALLCACVGVFQQKTYLVVFAIFMIVHAESEERG